MIKYQKRSISKPMNILSVKNLERFSIKSTLYPILLIIFIHFKSSFFDNRLIVRWGMTKYFIEFPLFKLAKSREISYNVSKGQTSLRLSSKKPSSKSDKNYFTLYYRKITLLLLLLLLHKDTFAYFWRCKDFRWFQREFTSIIQSQLYQRR